MTYDATAVRRQQARSLIHIGRYSATERGYLESVGLTGVYVGALMALGATIQEAEQEVLLLLRGEDDEAAADAAPAQEELPFHLGDEDDQEC